MRSDVVSPGVDRAGIPLSEPDIREEEWALVRECLESGWVSSAGTYVNAFERRIANLLGVGHAVATVNGTAALHVALRVAGVRAGDEVLVSTLSFIAPANALRYLGAEPVFVDAEREYWQMDATLVRRFLDERCDRRDGGVYDTATGRRIAALLPVHVLGHPVDIDAIHGIAAEWDLPVVQDAAESLGALYRGRPVGSSGTVACLSFNGNKVVTAGGGGMIVTDDPELAERARYLTTQAKDDPVEYVHHEVGYNYRLTNVQAAIGYAQCGRLEEYVEAKRAIAGRYAEGLRHIPGIATMPEAGWARSAFWLYTVLVDAERFGMDSRALMSSLRAAGIQSRPLWQPLHTSPAHTGSAVLGGGVAEELNARALSLPSSVGLTAADQDAVIRAIENAYRVRAGT